MKARKHWAAFSDDPCKPRPNKPLFELLKGDRDKTRHIYAHLENSGEFGLAQWTNVENLHNLLYKVCHDRWLNQFEISSYLHGVLEEMKRDLVYVPKHAWQIKPAEVNTTSVPGLGLPLPAVNFDERKDEFDSGIYCRRFIANVAHIEGHFVGFIYDRRFSVLYILDGWEEGREQRTAAIVSCMALYLQERHFSPHFSFAAIPVTRQQDMSSCGVICVHWIRQSLRDFMGIRLEEIPIRPRSLSVAGHACIDETRGFRPPPRTELFIRDWAMMPGRFLSSRKWAKTDVVTNACIMLGISDLRWFFARADRFNIRLHDLKHMHTVGQSNVTNANMPKGFLTFAGGYRVSMPKGCGDSTGVEGRTYYDGPLRMFHAGPEYRSRNWTEYVPRSFPERTTPDFR